MVNKKKRLFKFLFFPISLLICLSIFMISSFAMTSDYFELNSNISKSISNIRVDYDSIDNVTFQLSDYYCVIDVYSQDGFYSSDIYFDFLKNSSVYSLTDYDSFSLNIKFNAYVWFEDNYSNYFTYQNSNWFVYSTNSYETNIIDSSYNTPIRDTNFSIGEDDTFIYSCFIMTDNDTFGRSSNIVDDGFTMSLQSFVGVVPSNYINFRIIIYSLEFVPNSQLSNIYMNGASYDDGFANGYNQGYNYGYASGDSNGYNQGYENGYNNGLDGGYDSGYQAGYNYGINSNLETNGVRTLFNSILSFPVDMIKSVFNFEFMGVNIASVITFIISIGIVAFVLKKFL